MDKLVRVWTLSGKEEWVLVHVEIQTNRETDFAERMYVYNNRIYDKYRKYVASLAVLADDSPNWRPNCFEYTIWGCHILLEFPTVKLIDWQPKIDEIGASENIFGGVTAAHIRMLETRNDIPGRLRWKVAITQELYELGYERERVEHLFRFIDWLMLLPKDINQQYYNVMATYEESVRRPFVSIFEEMGMKRGMEKGMKKGMEEGIEKGMERGIAEGKQEGMKEGVRKSIIEAIQTMHGPVSQILQKQIESISETDQLRSLFRDVLKAESLDHITTIVASAAKDN